MYVACKQCNGWFNAVAMPDDGTVECIHCHAPIARRSSSRFPVSLEARYRDRAEFRALLAVQQAVLDKRSKHPEPPPPLSPEAFDAYGRPARRSPQR